MAISNLVCISGITFIRYAQNRMIRKSNEAIKPKGLNRIRSPIQECNLWVK